MTVAIGPAGIAYFAREVVAKDLATKLNTLNPPDRQIPVPGFHTTSGGCTNFYGDIKVSLSNGRLVNFAPGYQGVAQRASAGQFTLTLPTSDFTANYAWHESYGIVTSCGEDEPVRSDETWDGSYAIGVAKLTTTVTLGFVFDATARSYEIQVIGPPSSSLEHPSANIPGGSILQQQETQCFSSHVSDATASSVSAIDFAGSIATVFPPLLRSIPASGNLTEDIRYDFAIGDAGLTFPGNAGIAVGVRGEVTYKGLPYPGTQPAALPVPPPPSATDIHHLQLYVSGYELDALHWAFFQAGQLSVTVKPGDLANPELLKCKTYSAVKGFKPYASFGMTAAIAAAVAPTIAFQRVWMLTNAVETTLQGQLPANVFAKINSEFFQGNRYVDQQAFESDLTENGVDRQYWPAIESAAASMGMVLTQDLDFTLTIEDLEPDKPNLVFGVRRIDILDELRLGTRSAAQTMQFGFRHVGFTATFVSTTIPNFVSKETFGELIWPTVGEPSYVEALVAIGQAGTPLPIMAGFKFLFQQAELSIQQGYVSILAQVELKSS